MSKSELKKLISEHQKDKNTYFISPEKTRKPTRIELWESIAVAELLRCMELVKLDKKEKLSFLSNIVLEWSNWDLSRTARRMSHTTINKYVKSALKKMQSLPDFLTKTLPNTKAAEKDGPVTLREEIEDMFEEHSHYESEKPDRRKKSKYHKDYHATDKKGFQ